MTLTNFADGEVLTAAKLNDNFREGLTISGLNLARQLKDRSISYSSGSIDWWGDSFTSSGGRMSTINSGSTTATFSTDAYVIASGTSPLVVTMNIPTGTFSTTISSAFGVPHIKYWESGDDIDYKLTNSNADSGWLTAGTIPRITSFTSFTTEPTKLIVRLTPKSSSPTANYPGIYGFVVRSE